MMCCSAGGKDGIINPMVHNMAPAYDNAKYEYVWISTSRIKGMHVECVFFCSYMYFLKVKQ